MTNRYDYRKDYKNMSENDLRDALKKLIDRVLDAVATNNNSSFDDASNHRAHLHTELKNPDQQRAPPGSALP